MYAAAGDTRPLIDTAPKVWCKERNDRNKKSKRALSDVTIKDDADSPIRLDQCLPHWRIIDDTRHWLASEAFAALRPSTLVVVLSKVSLCFYLSAVYDFSGTWCAFSDQLLRL